MCLIVIIILLYKYTQISTCIKASHIIVSYNNKDIKWRNEGHLFFSEPVLEYDHRISSL